MQICERKLNKNLSIIYSQFDFLFVFCLKCICEYQPYLTVIDTTLKNKPILPISKYRIIYCPPFYQYAITLSSPQKPLILLKVLLMNVLMN